MGADNTLKMADPSQSLSLIDSLSSLRGDLATNDPLARLQALEISRNLQAELVTPAAALIRTAWAEPNHHWVLYTALDLNLFQILAEDDATPRKVADIAERCHAEPFLISRLLRMLAAFKSIAEVGPETYTLNNFSRYLLTESAVSTLKFMRWFQHVEVKAPEYLAAHNYKSPAGLRGAPFAWAYDLGDVTWFEHLAKDPRLGQLFGSMMTAQGQAKPTWCDGDLYPVKEKLHDVEDPQGALIVDVGGGNGHDLEWFRKNHPELKGRLVLQDLPYITDKIKLEGIEAMSHDFFTEQPINGAQVYFMHQIMHDYDDENCLKILRNILPAMKAGYSKIMINDLVLPDQGAHWYTATLDLGLMLTMGARERTQTQFVELVERVGGGLRVEKVWMPSSGGLADSLIECVIDE